MHTLYSVGWIMSKKGGLGRGEGGEEGGEGVKKRGVSEMERVGAVR